MSTSASAPGSGQGSSSGSSYQPRQNYNTNFDPKSNFNRLNTTNSTSINPGMKRKFGSPSPSAQGQQQQQQSTFSNATSNSSQNRHERSGSFGNNQSNSNYGVVKQERRDDISFQNRKIVGSGNNVTSSKSGGGGGVGSTGAGLGGMGGILGIDVDPRTVAMDLQGQLKKQSTMDHVSAFLYVQEASPTIDVNQVLEILKAQPRVEYNEFNQVFSYVPELTLPNISALRTYIRTHSTPLNPIPVRTLKEAIPPQSANQFSINALEQLEQAGDVLIMRTLTGAEFKDAPLPKLGKPNVNGLKITEGKNDRWKNVWWDEIRERGRAGKRVEDELIFAWDAVQIAETDDVRKLLEDQELSASSAPVAAPKVTAAPAKKKKRSTRALKITNTHMKALGVDFSKEYEPPS